MKEVMEGKERRKEYVCSRKTEHATVGLLGLF